MAFEQEMKVFGFHLTLAEGLINGIDAADAATSTCPGGQHPVWVIGHLAFVAGQVTSMLGGTPSIDMDRWKALFDGGTELQQGVGAYPAWDEVVAAWKKGHADVVALAPNAPSEALAGPCPYDFFVQAGLPTVHDFLSFVLTTHEGYHLGQLSAWRRAKGMPRLF